MKGPIGSVIVALVLLATYGGNNDKKVTIGVASNDTRAWEKAKELAKKGDIDVETKHFSDYNSPNRALNDGDIDINAFQHFVFLDQCKKTYKGTKISTLNTTVLAPLDIHSDRVRDVKKVKDGTKVVIPNDASNRVCIFGLLEAAGLVKLKKDFGLAGTVGDITSDPKHLKITTVDIQQATHTLFDVNIAIISNGVATKADKDPRNNPIFLEKSDSDTVKLYISVIAVSGEDLDSKTYAEIIELYHSKEAQKALQEDVKDGEKPISLPKDEVRIAEASLAR